jgi:hypothetical protein
MSIIVVLIALVIVVVIAGAAVYVLFLPSNSTAKTTGQQSTTRSQTSRSATALSSSGNQAFKTYSGTFSYSIPLGPSGDREGANSTVESYSSTQVASGTFSFFINPVNYTGIGSGQGTLTVTTTGFCSGSVTVNYSFEITNANDLLNGNITVAFAEPTPGSVMVPLTCTGDLTGVNTSTNNPVNFLPVYPNLVSVHTLPATVSQQLTGNISYQYTITPTN